MPKRIDYHEQDGRIQPRYATGTVEQDMALYTEQDHATWRALQARLVQVRPGRASEAYLNALRELAFDDEIPSFARLNTTLSQRGTGWQLVAVEGLLEDAEFYAHLAARRFPVSWWIRNPDQLDYIAEPDLFHDLVGHVPMLLDADYAGAMEAFGRQALALMDLDEGARQALASLYWFTIEFGLLQEDDGVRAYGAGILSSPQELAWCVGDGPVRVPFETQRAMRQDYRIDAPQGLYFVAQSLGQVREALETVNGQMLAACRRVGRQAIVERAP